MANDIRESLKSGPESPETPPINEKELRGPQQGGGPHGLSECYSYCDRFHRGNPTALRACYSSCDAIWKGREEPREVRPPGECFPQGIAELRDFLEKYTTEYLEGFESWWVVAEVAYLANRMLREGRLNKCNDVNGMIVRTLTEALDRAGVDRLSFREAYEDGVSDEVKQIVSSVFPNLTWKRKAQAAQISGPLTSPPQSAFPTLPESGSRRARLYQGHRRRGRGTAASLLVLLSLIALVYAVAERSSLSFLTSFILALTALIVRPKKYTAAWFILVILASPLIIGTIRGSPNTANNLGGSGSLVRLLSNATQPTSSVTLGSTQNSQQSLAIDAAWVNETFSLINSYRSGEGAPPLRYCPWLSDFAMVRFDTMVTDPAISHYDYEQDYQQYLGQYSEFLSTGEEVLFPSGFTPTQFVQYLESSAPLHWQVLMNPSYAYFGYYIGYGPTYVAIGSCNVSEIPGPNISIPQYLESHGCEVELENTTWLVVELSNWCSGPATISITSTFTLSPQFYEVFPLNYSLPTSQENATLTLYVTSTSPVKLFVLTPAQYNYYQSLYMQQAWSFTGPAYYYAGESETFKAQVELNVTQMSHGGYYLIVSNVLPNANTAYVVLNASITFTPQTPKILTP